MSYFSENRPKIERMNELLHTQYQLVQSSRQVLFQYCQQLSPAELVGSVAGFGRGSICNLLVHNARTYAYWLGKIGLGKAEDIPAEEAFSTLPEIEHYYRHIDELVLAFLACYREKWQEQKPFPLYGNEVMVTPLQLFTHVITHEFHHKGQVLSMGRQWGYVPVDTDVIRV